MFVNFCLDCNDDHMTNMHDELMVTYFSELRVTGYRGCIFVDGLTIDNGGRI